MSLDSCIKKLGNKVSDSDRAFLETELANGSTDEQALDNLEATINTETETLVTDIELQGGTVSYGVPHRTDYVEESKVPPAPPQHYKLTAADRKRLKKLKSQVPGLGRVLSWLQPDEQAALLTVEGAQNLVDYLRDMPSTAEMAAVAHAARAKRGWYANSQRALEIIFGEDAPRFAALLAALSPQQSVEANTLDTLRVWSSWIREGRPTDVASIDAIMARNVQGDKGEQSVMEAWRGNALRALTAEDPSTIVISGPKVNSFMLNLIGYQNEVTNDTWMANYSGVDQKLFSGSQSANMPGKKDGYLAMSVAVRKAAKKLGWTPAEVQETLWSWAKTLYEKARGEPRTALQILQDGDLTHEEIGGTVDFEQLFLESHATVDPNRRQPGVYREILEMAGYGEQLEKMQEHFDSREVQDLTGSTYEGNKTELNRAAKRLDKLARAKAAAAVRTEIQINLSVATASIPGLAKLQKEANAGDQASLALLQDVARDNLEYLMRGVKSAKITYTRATGLYDGKIEPSLGISMSFREADRERALAMLARFAENFNQQQVHVRSEAPPRRRPGTEFPDGSFVTPVIQFKLTAPLSRDEAQRVIDESGLPGLTITDDYIEAYYLGDAKDEKGINEFYEAAGKADTILGSRAREVHEGRDRLWAYGEGYGATAGFGSISGDFQAPQKELASATAIRIAARLAGKAVKPVAPASTITEPKRQLQRRIAQAYEAMRTNALDDPNVQRAYEELAAELLEQFDAIPIKAEIYAGEGQPYQTAKKQISSRLMRQDVLFNNHLYFYKTDADTFGPPGSDFTGHPLLEESGRTDMNGAPLLFNDLLRVVHDYYAHTMSTGTFGPRGEEAAWTNHMLMTKSPWARWALTSETRGQNSWVNFRDGMGDRPLRDRGYSEQKVDLLPLEMVITGQGDVDSALADLPGGKDLDMESPGYYSQSAYNDKSQRNETFYSGLHAGVMQLQQKKGSGKQMLAMIKKIPGVKQEEIEWIGLEDYLDGIKKITKGEILEFVQQRGVQVKDVLLGESTGTVDPLMDMTPSKAVLFGWRGEMMTLHPDGAVTGEMRNIATNEMESRQYDNLRDFFRLNRTDFDDDAVTDAVNALAWMTVEDAGSIFEEEEDDMGNEPGWYYFSSGEWSGGPFETKAEADAELWSEAVGYAQGVGAPDIEATGGLISSGAVQHSSSVEPGGENYRELLMTLPIPPKPPAPAITGPIISPTQAWQLTLANHPYFFVTQVEGDEVVVMIDNEVDYNDYAPEAMNPNDPGRFSLTNPRDYAGLSLTDEFAKWTNNQNLPDEGDAMDLLNDADLNPYQELYLRNFIARWEASTEEEQQGLDQMTQARQRLGGAPEILTLEEAEERTGIDGDDFAGGGVDIEVYYYPAGVYLVKFREEDGGNDKYEVIVFNEQILTDDLNHAEQWLVDHMGDELMAELANDIPQAPGTDVALADYRGYEDDSPAMHRESFTGGHYRQNNVLAHIRFNERMVNGKRVLFIEEIQSDWHQDGRKKGYRGMKATPEIVREIMVEEFGVKGGEQFDMMGPALVDYFNAADDSQRGDLEIDGGWDSEQVRRLHSRAAQYKIGTVPNAPFKKSWPLLAMKRMIRYAAEEGFDQISWTTGEQQARRWSLAQHIDKLHVKPVGTGEFNLVGYKNGHQAANKTVKADQLGDYIGEDLAKKVLTTPEEKSERGKELAEEVRVIDGKIWSALERHKPGHMSEADWQLMAFTLVRDRNARTGEKPALLKNMGKLEFENLIILVEKRDDVFLSWMAAEDGEQTFEGLDLDLGSKGMIGFYDKILPSQVAKYIKKLGSKVEMRPMRDPAPAAQSLQVIGSGVTPAMQAQANAEMAGLAPFIENPRQAAMADLNRQWGEINGGNVVSVDNQEIIDDGGVEAEDLLNQWELDMGIDVRYAREVFLEPPYGVTNEAFTERLRHDVGINHPELTHIFWGQAEILDRSDEGDFLFEVPAYRQLSDGPADGYERTALEFNAIGGRYEPEDEDDLDFDAYEWEPVFVFPAAANRARPELVAPQPAPTMPTAMATGDTGSIVSRRLMGGEPRVMSVEEAQALGGNPQFIVEGNDALYMGTRPTALVYPDDSVIIRLESTADDVRGPGVISYYVVTDGGEMVVDTLTEAETRLAHSHIDSSPNLLAEFPQHLRDEAERMRNDPGEITMLDWDSMTMSEGAGTDQMVVERLPDFPETGEPQWGITDGEGYMYESGYSTEEDAVQALDERIHDTKLFSVPEWTSNLDGMGPHQGNLIIDVFDFNIEDLSVGDWAPVTPPTMEVAEATQLDQAQVLADQALAFTDDEWGTEDQIEAENAFYQYASEAFGFNTEEDPHNTFLLRATTQEGVAYTMEQLRQMPGVHETLQLPAPPEIDEDMVREAVTSFMGGEITIEEFNEGVGYDVMDENNHDTLVPGQWNNQEPEIAEIDRDNAVETVIAEIAELRGNQVAMHLAALGKQQNIPSVHSFDVTDKMRDRAMEGQPLFQDTAPEQPADRARFYPQVDGERVIQLMEASDLSSFLHESGHLFLEMQKHWAKKYGATENQQAILDWLGISNWNQIGREQHEKWAETFEVYLREGKAPSLSLRRAFASFARWLKRIYVTVAETMAMRDPRLSRAKLNPEIIQIFDRLLATQAEIEEAAATPEYQQFYRSQEQAGMTDKKWAEYQARAARVKETAEMTLDEKVMAQYKKMKSKEWKAEKAPLIEEEKQRLSQEPIYQVMSDMVSIKDDDGNVVSEGRMDWHRLKAAIGEDPGGKFIGKAVGGGVDPGLYAEQYGFASVRDMYDQVNAAPGLKTAADQAAEVRMVQTHGDILNDGTLEQEVREAMTNDDLAAMLLMELRAENRPETKGLNRGYLKAEADIIIGEMKYKDIKPNKYYRAMVKFAQAAVRDEDPTEAKIGQLANHYLYRAAVKAKEKMEKNRKAVQAVQKRQYNPTQVEQAYIEAMKNLSLAYDLRRDPQERHAYLLRVLDFYAGQVDEGNPTSELINLEMLDPNMQKAIQYRLDNASLDGFEMTVFDDLTSEELQGVVDMLKHLRYVGGQMANLGAAERAHTREQGVESILDNGGKDAKVQRGKQTQHREAALTWSDIIDSIPSIANMVRKLDGYKPGGWAFENIYKLLNDGNSRKLEMQKQMFDQLQTDMAGISGIGLSRKDQRPFTTEAGKEMEFSSEEIFMMAVYWGTETSRESLMAGHELTEADVNTLMSRLTPHQLQMANAVWAMNELQWPDLRDAAKAVLGVAPPKLQATPFVVNGVQMTGGHMQLMYDSVIVELKDEQQRGMHTSTVVPMRASSTHARTGSGGKPVKLDINNITQSVEEKTHYIAFAEIGRDLRAIVNNKDVQAAIEKKHGPSFYHNFVHAIAGVTAAEPSTETSKGLARASRWMRASATFMHLAYSVRNVLQQFPAALISMKEVGPVKFTQASGLLIANPRKFIGNIKAKSKFMENRSMLVNREAREFMKKVVSTSKGAKMWEGFKSHGFMFQTMVDMTVAYPTWYAAYTNSIQDHGDEKRAIIEADTAVAESVGSGSDMHLGRIMQSSQNEFVKTMTVFGSWFNAYFQRLDKSSKGGTDFMNMHFIADGLLLPFVVANLTQMIIFDFPDEEEEWYEYAWDNTWRFLTGTLPLVREISSLINGFTPTTPLGAVTQAPVRVARELESFAKGNQSGLKLAADIGKAVGSVTKLPGSGNVWRFMDYTDSWLQGDEGDFFNPIQALAEGADKND